MGRVLQPHNSVLCNLDLFLKLFDITSTRSCQDVLISSGMFSHVELETQIRLVFAMKSHAPRAIESVSVSNGCAHSLAGDPD